MSTVERLNEISKISMMESILDKNLQPKIFSTIECLIYHNEFSKKLYDELKHLHIGRGESIETYVDSGITSGRYKWVDENLVEDISKIEIILSPGDENILRKISIRTRQTPSKIITQIIHERLMIENRRGVKNNG